MLLTSSDHMDTWHQVMALKKADTRHKGTANTLSQDEIETIVATIEYFGGNTRQAIFDLKLARYRVFDFLAMGIMSSDEQGGGRIGSKSAVQVLVYSFLKNKGDINKWIQDLRETDYEVVTDWEALDLSM